MNAYEQALESARHRGRSDIFRGVQHERFLLLNQAGRLSFWKHLLMKRSEFLCALCGERLAQDELDVDHIQPRSRGGQNDWSNLQATHSNCNRRKGNRV